MPSCFSKSATLSRYNSKPSAPNCLCSFVSLQAWHHRVQVEPLKRCRAFAGLTGVVSVPKVVDVGGDQLLGGASGRDRQAQEELAHMA